MKVNEFISKLQEVVDGHKTVYMWGVFGSPVTENLIRQKANQYPSWYTAARQQHFRSLIGKGYFGFDCVNLIKGILWGWDGDHSKTHGGARYNTAGVPDISANGMNQRLVDTSTDFNKIEIGSAVWVKGHIGVYIGAGKVIEATPRWSNNVLVSACLNIGSISGIPGRRWTRHGKLPYITYAKDIPEHIKILRAKVDSPDAWVQFIEDNKDHPLGKWLPDLIVKLAK